MTATWEPELVDEVTLIATTVGPRRRTYEQRRATRLRRARHVAAHDLATSAWWLEKCETQVLDGHGVYLAREAQAVVMGSIVELLPHLGLANGAEDVDALSADPRYDEECGPGYDEAVGPPDPHARRALYPGGHDLMDQEPELWAIALLQYMADVDAAQRALTPDLLCTHARRVYRGRSGGAAPVGRRLKRDARACPAVAPDGRRCRKMRWHWPETPHSAGAGASYVTWGDPAPAGTGEPPPAPERRTERPARRRRPDYGPNRYAAPCARCHLQVAAGGGHLYPPETPGDAWRVTHVDQETCLAAWEASAAPVEPPRALPASERPLLFNADPDRNPDHYTHLVEAWI